MRNARINAGEERLGSRRLVLLSGVGLIAYFGLAAWSPPPPTDAPAQSAVQPLDAPDQDQPVILITGSTGGLGREVARRLATTGAHIMVHGRNRERGQGLVEEIEREGVGSARFYAADLGSYDEVRALAAAIQRDYDRLDVLINNAGIWLEGAHRPVSGDGHELHFQVNYLAGFLLTRLLLPLIEDSAPSRIVNVSSAAQTPIDFGNVMLERGYDDGRAYAQSKLAQVMFTLDLADELEGTGVLTYSFHPATFMNTDMVVSRGLRPRTSVGEGAEAVLQLVNAPGLESGQYFRGLQPTRANAQAYDVEARARLRRLSERLTGS